MSIFKCGMKITNEETDYLCESTKLQSLSLVWHEHRVGRLTASKFGSICHTNFDSPSQSLVKSILCRQHVMTEAIRWGIGNESVAREAYCCEVKDHHDSFTVASTGLHIDPLYPHLGASPDGLINCTCCGKGVLELKCPYSIRDIDPAMIQRADFYLIPQDGDLRLNQKHNYYYQVQGQMMVCNITYCDFVTWMPKGMQIEQIRRDDSFCQMMREKLNNFFVKHILPHILTGETAPVHHVQSDACSSSGSPQPHAQDNLYCYCRKEESGNMVACDNPSCSIEWFHFSCVGLTSAPEGDWYCPDCTMKLGK